MARGSAKIVSLIDTSSGMRESGDLAAAKVALEKLVALAQPGDQLAIVSCDGGFIYPATGTLQVDGSATSAAAAAALEALATGGETDVSGAVARGLDLLREESEPRALVLFSDGAFDRGSDVLAALDPAIRVYTAAFGASGDRELLREIAGATGGRYLFAPDDIGLAAIYFDILTPSPPEGFP